MGYLLSSTIFGIHGKPESKFVFVTNFQVVGARTITSFYSSGFLALRWSRVPQVDIENMLVIL